MTLLLSYAPTTEEHVVAAIMKASRVMIFLFIISLRVFIKQIQLICLIYINVKEITGYKDKITEKDEDGKTVEKDNTTKNVKLKVNSKDKTFADRTVKENSTKEEVSINGKGTITIEVWIDGDLKTTLNINLNETTEKTIP